MSIDGADTWYFFTNHLHALLYVARHPDARLRTVAEEIGITERGAHRILTQLARGGYVTVSKNGRRNHYRINPDAHLRHRANIEVPLQPLITLVNAVARDKTEDQSGSS